jgi:hypothetical protein
MRAFVCAHVCVTTGVTWTIRTTSAPWAARYHHTSAIDAGAIYVIGGYDGTIYYQDVWVSTDGGARPDSGGGGVVGGYHREVLQGCYGVLQGTGGVLRCTTAVWGVLEGYSRGTGGTRGYSRGPPVVSRGT